MHLPEDFSDSCPVLLFPLSVLIIRIKENMVSRTAEYRKNHAEINSTSTPELVTNSTSVPAISLKADTMKLGIKF